MLEVRNLAVRYGRHVALAGVSAEVAKGEICVVLGANGAGKSSMLKAIAGMVKSEAGSAITMNGKPIAGMKPHLIVEEGIALVPEGRGIFGDLTVAENLQLGAFARRARRQEAATLDTIYALFPRLAERRGQIARTMSGGEQQMVAIGRALMSKPEILMLDEPSLGLSPLLSKELFKSLAAVATTGVGVLLVEQNARLSLKIAARGYLIENGAITGEDSAQALMRDPAVVNAYLGGGAGTGGHGRAPQVRLPAGFALPVGLEGIGRAIGDIAARAGAIQNAFVRALRRDGAPPSAFVGRYDAAAGPDPWAAVAEVRPQWRPNEAALSREAGRLAGEAEQLAASAAERMAAHVRSARLADGTRGGLLPRDEQGPDTPKPDAVRPDTPEPLPALPRAPRLLLGPSAEQPKARRHDAAYAEALAKRAGERATALARRSREQASRASGFAEGASGAAPSTDPIALAEKAAARLAAHLRQQRAAAQRPAVAASAGFVPLPPSGADHPLIGHNSAGAALDDEPGAAPRKPAKARSTPKQDRGDAPPKPESKPANEDADFDALAARAATISAAHYAQRRKALSVHTFPAAEGKRGKKHNPDPAKKKRKKHKEA